MRHALLVLGRAEVRARVGHVVHGADLHGLHHLDALGAGLLKGGVVLALRGEDTEGGKKREEWGVSLFFPGAPGGVAGVERCGGSGDARARAAVARGVSTARRARKSS